MLVQSFSYMLEQYRIHRPDGFDIDDEKERQKLLLLYPYTVVVEGYDVELATAEKFVDEHLKIKVVNLYYSKPGYDYFFCEFFFYNEDDALTFAKTVPGLATVFPNGIKSRSSGVDKLVDE